jgi:DnaJ family protein C protein 17
MSTDDLKAHAASNQDFYALLDLSPSATDSEIRRGYRKTALKYHPDKIANPTPADIEKFHLLQIANDVLSTGWRCCCCRSKGHEEVMGFC